MASKKVISNTIATFIWQISITVIGFAFTPYLLNNLGVERFGIWVLLNGIMASFGLLDMGMGSGLGVFVSEAYAKRDYAEINKMVSAGLLTYIIFSFVFLIFYVFRWNIIGLLKIPRGLIQESVVVFVLLIGVAVINNIMLVFRSFLIGIQNMLLPHFMAVAGQILFYSGCVVIIEKGHGLIEIAIWHFVLNLIFYIIFMFIIIKKYTFLTPWRYLPDSSVFKKLFSFGIKIQLTRISQVLNAHIGRIISGFMINISTVSVYDIATRITNLIRMIPYTMLYSLVPRVAEFNINEHKQRIYDIYKNASKYVWIVTFPAIFFIILISEKLVILWLGRTDFSNSALIVKIVALGYMFEILAYPAMSVAYACKHPEFEMKKSLLNTVINLVLGVVLVVQTGYIGIAFAIAIAFVISSIYFLILFYKKMRFILEKDFIFLLIKIVISGIMGILPLIFIKINYTDRMNLFMFLSAVALIYFVIYIAVLYFFKVLNKKDTELFKDFLRMRLRNG